MRSIRLVTVLGCGLIGTSAALALRRAGVQVRLVDRVAAAVAEAERMGAGTALDPADPPADVVLIATPPGAVAETLRDAQTRGLGAAYTDVAGVKARVVAAARDRGCDLTTYVPGHPMAGGERLGPGAAAAELFAGRPWALCPTPATSPAAIRAATELVTACGGAHSVLSPEAHDRAVASVSHLPHVVSAALAARIAAADEAELSLAGAGLRDTTRIAAGPAGLWDDILRHNAGPVAAELESVVSDLAAVARDLRTAGSDGALSWLLRRGNRGRARLDGRQSGEVRRAA